MSGPIWIVCERNPRWAPALRRSLPGDHRLVEVRQLAEVSHALASYPTAMIAVEVDRLGVNAALASLPTLPQRYAKCTLVAMVDDDLASDCHVHAALREAGAAEIATSPRQLDHITRLAEAHFRAADQSRSRSGDDCRAQIWSRLPWQATTTGWTGSTRKSGSTSRGK